MTLFDVKLPLFSKPVPTDEVIHSKRENDVICGSIRAAVLISKNMKNQTKNTKPNKSEKVVLRRYWAILQDDKIYLHIREDSECFMIMNLDFLHVRLKSNDQNEYYLRFKNKIFSQEIYFASKAEAQVWYDALHKACTYSRFFSDFTICSMLGVGNYARVFSVSRHSDKKLFACKSFNKAAVTKDELDLKSLLNEISILRSMNHPNIMPLEMLYEGSQFIYCLTPLYGGGCLLDAVIKAGNFSQYRSIIYLKQLIIAAAYLEAKDYMHRDIKPENVLLTENCEEIVLVDFGFATKKDEYDQLFIRCGTPGYVAPEILQDVPYDSRVDVFSIGVIFYVMLTGNVPFVSDDPDELIDVNARCEIDFDLSKFGVDLPDDCNP